MLPFIQSAISVSVGLFGTIFNSLQCRRCCFGPFFSLLGETPFSNPVGWCGLTSPATLYANSVPLFAPTRNKGFFDFPFLNPAFIPTPFPPQRLRIWRSEFSADPHLVSPHIHSLVLRLCALLLFALHIFQPRSGSILLAPRVQHVNPVLIFPQRSRSS